MLKKLEQSPLERLKNKFHDHPLLLTCQKAFRHYMANLDSFDFTAEELFVEVADVLDKIFEEPDTSSQFVNGLWDELKIGLKEKKRSMPPQQDLDVVCGIICYVVAAALSLHWREYYKHDVSCLLTDLILNKKIFSQEEEEQIIKNLCVNAQRLKEWINDYEESDIWLSDEIAESLTAPDKPKEEKKIDFIPTGETFTKTTKVTDIQLTLIMQRLTQANKLDPNESADDWLKLFSGVNSLFSIKWLGTPGELRDLFSLLTNPKNKGDTGYVIPSYNYQKIVISHFRDKNGNYFNRLSGQKTIRSFKSILNDCECTLQVMTDSMTTIMKEIINNNMNALEEKGLSYNIHAVKNDDNLRIRKNR